MRDYTIVILIGAAFLIGLAVGTWLGMDVDAFNRNMVAVEGPSLPHPMCERGEWYVQSGDTVNGIIATCYDNPHYGRVKADMRPLNAHIADLGRIYPGQTIYLPERGR